MGIISGGRITPGSGLDQPLLNAGAPTSGGAGTYVGVAPKGAMLTDTTNAVIYINTGTQASPTWTKVGTQT